jgi:membrane AbrB-like protein
MASIPTLLVVGYLGALLAKRVRLPSATLLGPMFATAAWSLLAPRPPYSPDWLRSAGLILLGIQIGSSVEREAIVRLGKALPVALVMIAGMIATSLGLGWIIHTRLVPDIEMMTVVLGVMPGGASGLAAAARELNGEPALVGAMHSVRLFIVLSLLPTLLPSSLLWGSKNRDRP